MEIDTTPPSPEMGGFVSGEGGWGGEAVTDSSGTYPLPQVDETRCTLCGLCVEACPCQAVKLGEQGPVFACPEACPHTPACAGTPNCCCQCEEVCPTGAIACAFEIVFGKG